MNANHELRSGLILSTEKFIMRSRSWDTDTERMGTQLDRTGASTIVQAFTSWKWRWNEQWMWRTTSSYRIPASV